MGEHEGEVQYTATKAIVGSAIGTVIAFLGAIITGLADEGTPNVLTPTEWLIATVVGLTALGGVFGGVYATTNRVKA